VAADHLVGGGGGDSGEVERAGFLGQPRVVDDLEQQIAELVGQRREVVAGDRVGDLVGFLDRVRRDRLEGLVAVPRAGSRSAAMMSSRRRSSASGDAGTACSGGRVAS